MSEPSPQRMPATNHLIRIVMIVVVSCAVGPLIAGSVLWIELTSSEVYRGTALPISDWPAVWWGIMLIGYMVGVPYALLTSGVYALLAVLVGLPQLATALIIAVIPAFLFFTTLGAVTPSWQNVASFWAGGFMMIGIATTVCWYLSRRWHSPDT